MVGRIVKGDRYKVKDTTGIRSHATQLIPFIGEIGIAQRGTDTANELVTLVFDDPGKQQLYMSTTSNAFYNGELEEVGVVDGG